MLLIVIVSSMAPSFSSAIFNCVAAAAISCCPKFGAFGVKVNAGIIVSTASTVILAVSVRFSASVTVRVTL